MMRILKPEIKENEDLSMVNKQSAAGEAKYTFRLKIHVVLCLSLFLFLICLFTVGSQADSCYPNSMNPPYTPGQSAPEIVQIKNKLAELGYFKQGTKFSNEYSSTLEEVVTLFRKKNGLSPSQMIDSEFLTVLYSSKPEGYSDSEAGKIPDKHVTDIGTTNEKKATVSSGNSSISRNLTSDLLWVAFAIIFILIIGILVYFFGPNQRNASQIPQIDFHMIDGLQGAEFEKWTARLLSYSGYSGIRMTKTTGDFGADIICFDSQDDKYVVQCKRYSGKIGISAVQEIMGAKQFYSAQYMIRLSRKPRSQRII